MKFRLFTPWYLFFLLPCCVFFFQYPRTVFAGGGKEKTSNFPGSESVSVPGSSMVTGTPPETGESRRGQGNTADNNPVNDRAEAVFRAIAKAYPDRIGEIEFLDGDWNIEVYGEKFFYADGRLLPVSLKDRRNEYDPQPFYNYPAELPPWQPPTMEESEAMKEQDARRRTRQPKRSPHFYDTLWRTHNRDESWEHVKQIRFLGHAVMVHYSILVQLSLVEEQILRMAKTNTAVSRWVNNIKSIDGWNWRNIAESQSRSYHAYGAAIDFLPKSLGGLETYWLWTANHTPEWWTVPYTRRFHPPQEVINAFESYGFIWGGKWRYYDTMHFEYRPEILVLSGIIQKDLRELR